MNGVKQIQVPVYLVDSTRSVLLLLVLSDTRQRGPDCYTQVDNPDFQPTQQSEGLVMLGKIVNRPQLLIKALTIVGMLLALNACETPNEAAHPQRTEIRTALQQAFEQRRDPFVIVEGECDCFVQFMHDGGTLFYDFPNVGLADDIRGRAHEYHSQQGIEEIVIEDIDPDTMQKFSLSSWQRGYARAQVDAATDAAILALYRIYNQDRESKFVLIKGWE